MLKSASRLCVANLTAGMLRKCTKEPREMREASCSNEVCTTSMAAAPCCSSSESSAESSESSAADQPAPPPLRLERSRTSRMGSKPRHAACSRMRAIDEDCGKQASESGWSPKKKRCAVCTHEAWATKPRHGRASGSSIEAMAWSSTEPSNASPMKVSCRAAASTSPSWSSTAVAHDSYLCATHTTQPLEGGARSTGRTPGVGSIVRVALPRTRRRRRARPRGGSRCSARARSRARRATPRWRRASARPS